MSKVLDLDICKHYIFKAVSDFRYKSRE